MQARPRGSAPSDVVPYHHHHNHSNHNHSSSNHNHNSSSTRDPGVALPPQPSEPPPLDLGPAAPTLGSALEAGYVAARQAVRAANGIRSLMQLLQPKHAVGPAALPAAALERIRCLACRCLVGLAGDPAIRQILTRLQVCACEGGWRCGMGRVAHYNPNSDHCQPRTHRARRKWMHCGNALWGGGVFGGPGMYRTVCSLSLGCAAGPSVRDLLF